MGVPSAAYAAEQISCIFRALGFGLTEGIGRGNTQGGESYLARGRGMLTGLTGDVI
jgi:hypothetical protein